MGLVPPRDRIKQEGVANPTLAELDQTGIIQAPDRGDVVPLERDPDRAGAVLTTRHQELAQMSGTVVGGRSIGQGRAPEQEGR